MIPSYKNLVMFYFLSGILILVLDKQILDVFFLIDLLDESLDSLLLFAIK